MLVDQQLTLVFTSATNDDSQVDFEILSYNVRGLGNEKKRKSQKAYF